MYELTYKHPLTNEIVIERDPDRVSCCTLGVMIELTKKTSIFVPWQQITGIMAPTEALVELFNLAAFG